MNQQVSTTTIPFSIRTNSTALDYQHTQPECAKVLQALLFTSSYDLQHAHSTSKIRTTNNRPSNSTSATGIYSHNTPILILHNFCLPTEFYSHGSCLCSSQAHNPTKPTHRPITPVRHIRLLSHDATPAFLASTKQNTSICRLYGHARRFGRLIEPKRHSSVTAF
jgi:hypothetical protein